MVGDPYDVFAPGAVRHPLRPLLRWWSPRRLRKLCAGACAAAYVTERTLQRRYPPAPDAYTTHYSSVELPAEAFVPAARVWAVPPDRTRLVFVGSLAQMYKAPDVLLEAVARCRAQGLACQLAMVGDGKHRSELEARARALGLEDSVRFMGQIPAGDAVRQQLDAADLFVLPSRTEGLPRAMIEAMARGLPCIGTSVGGIPELLPVEDLVSPGDADALAAKMRAMLADPQRMTAMSRRNLEKARQFADEVLRQRRTAFYTYVRERTEAWLKTPR
ncbi:MAG: glycosyltransferase family 4 protein [Fastidiosipilaceae bacterium]